MSDIKIIAELAQGFEGNLKQASLLLKAASSAGADAAKFQLVYADELGTPDYKYYDLFRGLEMADQDWDALNEEAKSLKIELYFDVFGSRSLALAERMGIRCIKLHGTDISNVGFLKEVAASKVPSVLLGAGGAFLSEIEKALEILDGKHAMVLLGFQAYPTPDDTNAISRVKTLIERWAGRSEITVGFADHADPMTSGSTTFAATALGAGARVFEKHLTLGRNMQLEDHEAALNPDEFALFSSALRVCFSAMGEESRQDDFAMTEAEKSYRKMIRRHVVSSGALEKGTVLEPEHIILKRSGIEDFISDIETVYGRTLTRDLAANEPVRQSDLKD